MTTDMMNAFLAFAAVLFAALTVALIIEGSSDWRRRRTVRRRLLAGDRAGAEQTSVGRSDILAERHREGTALDVILARIPHFRDVALQLEQADLRMTVSAYLALALGLASALALAVNLGTGSTLLTVLAAVGGGAMPHFYVKLKKNSRLHAFEASFPEAIDLMTRAIRAGHSLSAGLQVVATDGPTAVAGEFQRVFEEHRFGLPFSDALMGLADRIEIPDVRIFVTAILVQRETGGNLAEILEKIASVLRARFVLRRQLRVYTAQGRLTGMVLMALPAILAFGMYALDPDYMSVLIEETIGLIMVGAAVILQVSGLFWIRQIINIDM
jgi:tight adherence protein B